MPNGYDHSKEYGPHDYAGPGRTNDCKYGCGCWMGPFQSGGPIGLDPFGECPKNPKDHRLLGGDGDLRVVVERRIAGLEKRAATAEARAEELEEINKSKKAELYRENKQLKEKLQKLFGEMNKSVQILERLLKE